MDRKAGPPPFSSILAPVDGLSLSEIAVRRARALLAFPGCRLTLLHVGPDEDRRRRVERLASEARDWGAEVSVRVIEGGPSAEKILHEVESGRHDLVLMTTRRRPAVARAVAGNVALSVLRRSPAPLLLYRPLSGLDESFFAVERSEPATFKRLVLMLDGSVLAEGVLDSAQRLAKAFGSEVILFQAIEGADITQDRMESVRAYLAEQAEAANRLGIPARLHIAVGDPAEQALRMLDQGADSIALTTRGRSFWGSMFLGSVASRVLGIAEGPTLCVSSSGVRRVSHRRIGAVRSGKVE